MVAPYVVHDQGLLQFASGGFAWTDGMMTLLLDTGVTDIDPTLATVGAILASATEVAAPGYSRQQLTSATVTLDGVNHRVLLASDPVAFGSPDAGSSYDKLLIYLDQGSDATSIPLISYDLSDSGSSRTTDGNPVNVNPDSAGFAAFAQA